MSIYKLIGQKIESSGQDPEGIAQEILTEMSSLSELKRLILPLLGPAARSYRAPSSHHSVPLGGRG